jgi:excinuclease ABC subunit C
MIDAHGELIYVGKSRSLRGRLLSYFRPGREEKAARIVADTRRVVWETASSEFAALLRELELIQRWQPRYNVQGQPRRRRRCYVCLGRGPAPQVFLAPRPPKTAQHCYGPVAGAGQAREAVRRLNDWFRLRDCPQQQSMIFADQRELFSLPRAAGCIRHEIGNCLGPCAAACTQEEYAGNHQAARAFLEGRDTSPLEVLQRDMQTASAGLAFERAAALRDRLDSLRWLSRQLERLRQAAGASFVYPVLGSDSRERWYLIHHGGVRAMQAAPANATEALQLAGLLQRVYRPSSPEQGPIRPEEVDGVLLVDGWFRRHKEERLRVREPAEILSECRKVEGLDISRG